VTADNTSSILAAFKDLTFTMPKLLEYGAAGSTQGPSNQTQEHRVTKFPPTSSSVESQSNPFFEENDNRDCLSEDFTVANIQEAEETLITDSEMNAAIDAVILEWGSGCLNRIRRNSCLAHLLQLAIKDALRNKEVAAIIKKVSTIVTWFHKSDKNNTALRQLCKLGLVRPCDTRWNSLYHCLKRLCRELSDDDNEEKVGRRKEQMGQKVLNCSGS